MDTTKTKQNRPKSLYPQIIKNLANNWQLYLLLLPMLIWFLLFVYQPIGGMIVAFKSYSSKLGIWNSDFAGLHFFKELLVSRQEAFWSAFRNTFVINLYGIIFGFPIPIVLALFFSEIGLERLRKIFQSVSYLPHFLSEVTVTTIVIYLVRDTVITHGIVAQIFIHMGALTPGTSMLEVETYFRPIYIITGIWKEAGYSSIVYFAAIMGVSPVLYEAFKVEGGNKLQEIKHVTLPGISSTLIIMLIMRIGRMLSVGYERVILLMNTKVESTGQVISSYVHKIGFESGGASGELLKAVAGAADLFNTLIAFALVIGANTISRHTSKTALW